VFIGLSFVSQGLLFGSFASVVLQWARVYHFSTSEHRRAHMSSAAKVGACCVSVLVLGAQASVVLFDDVSSGGWKRLYLAMAVLVSVLSLGLGVAFSFYSVTARRVLRTIKASKGQRMQDKDNKLLATGISLGALFALQVQTYY
jgi:hypothetical protein